MSRRLVLGSAVLLLAIAGGLPVVAMLAQAFFAGGRFDPAPLAGLLTDAGTWRLLGSSILLAAAVALAACAAGIPLGVLLARTDLPGRRLLAALFTVPLLLPPWVLAVAWAALAGREGLLAPVVGPGAALALDRFLYGPGGCVLVLGTAFLPVPLLLTMAALAEIDPRLEEAGRLHAGWGTVLVRISLPLALPGLLLAAVLVFLLALGEFTVPGFFRVDVFATRSLERFAAFYDVRGATAAALPLAAAALLVLPLESAFLGRRGAPLPGAGTRRRTVPLGRFRAPALAGVLFVAGVLVALPLSALAARAAAPGAFRGALARAGDALPRTIAWSVTGASLLLLGGVLLGLVVGRRELPGWRAVDGLALFLFALPGAVTGIGLVALWNRPATAFLYGTPLVVLLGWFARYAALPLRVTTAHLRGIPPALEEAARLAGASWWLRTRRVTLPLLGRGLFLAWIVGYVFCARDTAIAMLVYPPGRDTLPVRIVTLMANGTPGMVAALCLLATGVVLLPVAVVLPVLAISGREDRR